MTAEEPDLARDFEVVLLAIQRLRESLKAGYTGIDLRREYERWDERWAEGLAEALEETLSNLEKWAGPLRERRRRERVARDVGHLLSIVGEGKKPIIHDEEVMAAVRLLEKRLSDIDRFPF